MVIDDFSKYGRAVLLKNKSESEVRSALRRDFKENTALEIWVDSGKVLYTNDVHKLLKDQEIEIYSTKNNKNPQY